MTGMVPAYPVEEYRHCQRWMALSMKLPLFLIFEKFENYCDLLEARECNFMAETSCAFSMKKGGKSCWMVNMTLE